MPNIKSDTAKFAFFYMLSLVALVFMALSSGLIIFQIINKLITDAINQYSSNFSSSQLKFAISAIIISAPIYFLTTKQIFKNLFSGRLSENSGVRRWLTYFILFISSVVMIGWFIAIINSFLDGEFTLKFILKALTVIAISGIIFSFYFYDIKRENIQGKKDKIIKIYFVASLIAVILIFVSSLFFVESPIQTRNRKMDEKVLSQFNRLNQGVVEYYNIHKKLPENFKVLLEDKKYLTDKDTHNPFTGKLIDYKIKSDTTYEFCATFLTSNIDQNNDKYLPYEIPWAHQKGYQCLAKYISLIKTQELDRIKTQ